MMNNLLNSILPSIPIGDGFEWLIDFLQTYFGWLFDAVTWLLRFLVDGFEDILAFIPALVLIVLFAGLAWLLANTRKSKIYLTLGTLFGLYLIYNMGFWDSAIATLALVLIASLIALVIGIPIGIFAAKSRNIGDAIIRPILDFMQTMPAFVYLIPAVILFSRGVVGGAIATIIFSMPPVVRLTNLGIRQVPDEVMEAAQSLGSTSNQLLFKVQLPIALPTIFAGINQTIMLALSMVVIASMIGAGGLGSDVRLALSRPDQYIGYGFEAGIAVVIIAIIIDRMTQSLSLLSDKKSK